MKRLYLGVIGGSVCSGEIGRLACRTGMAIARSGAVLVCGGMGGVMKEACRGAREQGGVTIGVLPGGDRSGANPYLDYSIPTGIGESRNVIVVRSSDALIAIDGSYGTLSEIAFALRFGKPVIGLKTWKATDFEGTAAPLIYADDPDEAVKLAVEALKKK